MRIGVYDPYLDDLGGGEKYMGKLAECLSKEHSVFVFWDNKEDFEKLSNRFDLDFSKVVLTKNIFNKKIGFFERFLESGKYDAILLLSDGSIPVLRCKKLFLHLQQPFPQGIFSSLKTSLKMMRVRKIFCNSNFTKSYVEKKYQSKTVVVYPPVVLHSEEVKKENVILHVGRFRVHNLLQEDYKKQGSMIQAFREMVDNGFKDWKFMLAVSVHDKEKEKFSEIQKKTEGYPIEFHVNKTNKQLWEIYNRAKIYWHASGFSEDLNTHPEFAEHFGISTVEAMGAGAVPVVFNAGGQKEIVEEGRSGFVWDTLSELKEKTLLLTSDNNLWKKLSDGAKVRAEKYAENEFCKNIDQLLQE